MGTLLLNVKSFVKFSLNCISLVVIPEADDIFKALPK